MHGHNTWCFHLLGLSTRHQKGVALISYKCSFYSAMSDSCFNNTCVLLLFYTKIKALPLYPFLSSHAHTALLSAKSISHIYPQVRVCFQKVLYIVCIHLYMYRFKADWPDIWCKTSCTKAQAISQPNYMGKQPCSHHVRQLSGELAVTKLGDCIVMWQHVIMWSCDHVNNGVNKNVSNVFNFRCSKKYKLVEFFCVFFA